MACMPGWKMPMAGTRAPKNQNHPTARQGARRSENTTQKVTAARTNTLLMTANTYLIDAQTRKANYHPVTAFDPICYLVQSPAVFVVNSASGG